MSDAREKQFYSFTGITHISEKITESGGTAKDGFSEQLFRFFFFF